MIMAVNSLCRMSNRKANHRIRRCLSTIAALLTLGTAVQGADWPQFMGPNGNGTSAEKGLMRSWPAEGPKVLWRIPLGPGYGGASVRAGKVYVMDRTEQKADVMRCLDLATGKEVWKFSYDAPGAIDHEGSRSTPTVGEKYVYTVGPFGHFHCLDLATHQVVWKKNILADFGAKAPRWSVTQSPLLYQDMVIVAPQSDSIGLVAYDQITGKEKWHSSGIGPMAYGSPMKINIAGMDQIVIVNPQGAAAVSAADGKLLWKYAHPCKIPIPNVTELGGGKLFITGAYLAGSAIFQVSKQGEAWTAKELASIKDIGGHCHPALAYQNHLYLLCNTNERADGMVCFDFDGKIAWQTKNSPYLCKGGSLLTADGLIYVMDGKSGELYIVEPLANEFKSLGKVKLLEGREIWGPLALADGKLLIRDQTQMKCLDIQSR
jgi:outer membrane protein assembly factor BamB